MSYMGTKLLILRQKVIKPGHRNAYSKCVTNRSSHKSTFLLGKVGKLLQYYRYLEAASRSLKLGTKYVMKSKCFRKRHIGI